MDFSAAGEETSQMSSRSKSGAHESVEPLIVVMRNQRVILDADLARLYGAPTKRFNEAFKRNRQRFPHDFAFQLTKAELNNLRSQLAGSNLQPIESMEGNSNWSQFATSSIFSSRFSLNIKSSGNLAWFLLTCSFNRLVVTP